MSAIKGYKLDFEYTPNSQHRPIVNACYRCGKTEAVLAKLVNMGAVEVCSESEGQIVSPLFLRAKADGMARFILNLKRLNSFIKKAHFKMEDVRTALNLLEQHTYMCRLDLKDAYLRVPIDSNYTKFLRFEYGNLLYQFLTLPFGLCSAPLVFTKIIKPVLNYLREKGIKQ